MFAPRPDLPARHILRRRGDAGQLRRGEDAAAQREIIGERRRGARLAQQVGVGQLDRGQIEFARVAPGADCRPVAPALKSRAVRLDHERRDAAAFAPLIFGMGVDDSEVGIRAVGDEDFRAVEHPAAAAPQRAGAHRVGRQPVKVGIAEAAKAARAPLQQRFKKRRALLGRRRVELRRRIRIEQPVARSDHPRAVLAGFFDNSRPRRVGQLRAPPAAGRREQVIQPHLPDPHVQLGEQVVRQPRRVRIEPLLLQPDFAPHEAAHALQDQGQLGVAQLLHPASLKRRRQVGAAARLCFVHTATWAGARDGKDHGARV